MLWVSKQLFLGQFVMIFPYLLSKLSYMNYFKILKMAAILAPELFFIREFYRKLRALEQLPMPLPTFRAFDRRSSPNIDEILAIFEILPIFDPVT